jgi:hypothetical protein
MEDHPWGRVVENYKGRVEEEDICKCPSKWLILVEPKPFNLIKNCIRPRSLQGSDSSLPDQSPGQPAKHQKG